MEHRAYNFSAGPAILPEEVLKQAQGDLWNYRSSGMGVSELSHRGSHFEEIIESAEQLLRELLELPSQYSVLFCTGGATQQFSMVPMNFLSANRSGNYLVSGVWAELAAEEAKKFGSVHIAGSSKEISFRSLPQDINVSSNAAYLHFTSNNTVIGSQYSSFPVTENVPLICDASSDILSRPMDISKLGILYAGAQKNIGIAGVTVVIVRNDLLEQIPEGLPILCDYRTYKKNRSLYNTPPTVPIYFLREVLLWVKKMGGVLTISERNKTKANLLYEAIDSMPLYKKIVSKDCRSQMNITFRIESPEQEKQFLFEAEKNGFFGLKGHRIVGGIRASMYNAFPIEGTHALVQFMTDFAAKNSSL